MADIPMGLGSVSKKVDWKNPRKNTRAQNAGVGAAGGAIGAGSVLGALSAANGRSRAKAGVDSLKGVGAHPGKLRAASIIGSHAAKEGGKGAAAGAVLGGGYGAALGALEKPKSKRKSSVVKSAFGIEKGLSPFARSAKTSEPLVTRASSIAGVRTHTFRPKTWAMEGKHTEADVSAKTAKKVTYGGGPTKAGAGAAAGTATVGGGAVAYKRKKDKVGKSAFFEEIEKGEATEGARRVVRSVLKPSTKVPHKTPTSEWSGSTHRKVPQRILEREEARMNPDSAGRAKGIVHKSGHDAFLSKSDARMGAKAAEWTGHLPKHTPGAVAASKSAFKASIENPNLPRPVKPGLTKTKPKFVRVHQ